jgi:hypothetical protein
MFAIGSETNRPRRERGRIGRGKGRGVDRKR